MTTLSQRDPDMASAPRLTPRNAMSVDLLDWYHYLDADRNRWAEYRPRLDRSVDLLLEIFGETGTKATFFVLGHVAATSPDLVRQIHAAGHEVASHGYAHRFVYGQTPEAFADDVRRSVDSLSAITGTPVFGYRAPRQSITERSLWAVPILRDLGFRYDSSLRLAESPGWPHRLSAGVVEVPVTRCELGGRTVACGGGSCFRALPYHITAWLFGRLRRRAQPIVFRLYAWELDAGQPRVSMGWRRRLGHYHGLRSTAARLRRLCRDFAFGPIGRAMSTWDT